MNRRSFIGTILATLFAWFLPASRPACGNCGGHCNGDCHKRCSGPCGWHWCNEQSQWWMCNKEPWSITVDGRHYAWNGEQYQEIT